MDDIGRLIGKKGSWSPENPKRLIWSPERNGLSRMALATLPGDLIAMQEVFVVCSSQLFFLEVEPNVRSQFTFTV